MGLSGIAKTKTPPMYRPFLARSDGCKTKNNNNDDKKNQKR